MKSETFASTKFLLAALGLAFVKAGQVLVEESSKLDAMDDELPSTDAAAPSQITTADITTAERDSSGLPYDARIHAETRGVNKDGTWKRRRNVSEEVVDAVTAELRATNAPTPAAPVADAAPSIPAPPVVAAVQIPVLRAAPAVTDYTKLCDFLAKNTGEGCSLNDDWIGKFFAANDTTLPALASDPDKAGKLLTALRDTLKQYSIPEVV